MGRNTNRCGASSGARIATRFDRPKISFQPRLFGPVKGRVPLAHGRKMQRDQQRRIAAEEEHILDPGRPDFQVQPRRQIHKRVREAVLRVESGSLFPFQEAEIVLLGRLADVLPRSKLAEALVTPAARQLARDPGMRELADHYQPGRIFALNHGTMIARPGGARKAPGNRAESGVDSPRWFFYGAPVKTVRWPRIYPSGIFIVSAR